MALTETAPTNSSSSSTSSGVFPSGVYPVGATFSPGEFTVFSVMLASPVWGASAAVNSWTKIASRQEFSSAGAGTYYTLETFVRRQTTTRVAPSVFTFGTSVSWTWAARTYYGASNPAIVSGVDITGRAGGPPPGTSYSLSTSVTSTAGGRKILITAATTAGSPTPLALGAVLPPGTYSSNATGTSPLPQFLETFILGDIAWVPPSVITAAGRLLTHRIIHPPALQKRF